MGLVVRRREGDGSTVDFMFLMMRICVLLACCPTFQQRDTPCLIHIHIHHSPSRSLVTSTVLTIMLYNNNYTIILAFLHSRFCVCQLSTKPSHEAKSSRSSTHNSHPRPPRIPPRAQKHVPLLINPNPAAHLRRHQVRHHVPLAFFQALALSAVTQEQLGDVPDCELGAAGVCAGE